MRRKVNRDKRTIKAEEAITKQKQTIDSKKVENKEKQLQLANAKAELVKKEYQDNLKEYMEQRLYDLIYKLKHVETGKHLSTIELRSLISQKNTIGASPKYNNTELTILFDYYKQFIEKINQIQKYLPTKKNFCSFIGISSVTYDSYKQSDDTERREIMQMIDDYITDIMLTSAQDGEIKEVTTIYRTKAEHGMVEAQAPIVIEHKSEANINNIKQQIEAINKGKSLKTIWLDKQEDGSYGLSE